MSNAPSSLRRKPIPVLFHPFWLGLLLATSAIAAAAPIGPESRAETWWDASRADRIGFSDHAAAACKSQNCDSLQIRSCLNDRLKPPTSAAMRDKTIAEVTAACIAGFKARP